jgi:hypothetical protein
VEGAPDLIIEILSARTLRLDLVDKKREYGRVGVIKIRQVNEDCELSTELLPGFSLGRRNDLREVRQGYARTASKSKLLLASNRFDVSILTGLRLHRPKRPGNPALRMHSPEWQTLGSFVIFHQVFTSHGNRSGKAKRKWGPRRRRNTFAPVDKRDGCIDIRICKRGANHCPHRADGSTGSRTTQCTPIAVPAAPEPIPPNAVPILVALSEVSALLAPRISQSQSSRDAP